MRPKRIGGPTAPHLSVIWYVGAALGLSLTWTQITFAFLAASTAVGSVPGGIGPVDGAPVFALGAFGAAVDLAAAAVIGHRVLTVRLPLLPGALVLSVLVQRKVL